MTDLHHIFAQYSHRRGALSIFRPFQAGHYPKLAKTAYHDLSENISDFFLQKAVKFGDFFIRV